MLTNVQQLHDRMNRVADQTIGSLAQTLALPVPQDLQHHKGWLGQLLELALGTDAGCKSQPDFTNLGIELKTIPVTTEGKPRQSTYVCTVPLQNLAMLTYETSVVCAKLSHVLWIPILTMPEIPIADYRILIPRLWQPDEEQYAILHTDFNEIMDLIAMGGLSQVTASMGEALHVRPKAAHARVLTQGISHQGASEPTLPRGFYLRPSFTGRYCIPS